MNERSFKKLKRYLVKGNQYVLYGIIIAAFIMFFVTGAELFSMYTVIIVVVSVLMGAVLYSIGYINMKKSFNELTERLKKLGRMEIAVNDFENAQQYFGDRVRIGKYCIYIKGYGILYFISDITGITYSEYIPNSTTRNLYAHTADGKQQFIAEVSDKNAIYGQQIIDAVMQRVEMR